MGNNIVFLYPGQGSQQVGMGLDLYQAYPEARQIFDQADYLLGFPLSRLCFEGPEEELNGDLNAQLAIYTLSCVITDILKVHDVVPDEVSGYSSGFYASAYAAGCFDFAHGLHVVRRAGEILLDEGQKIDGKMAVILGFSPEKVDHVCQKVGDVQVAIHNTPRQTVISGIGSSVARVLDICVNDGALDAYALSVATAYHSRFMEQSRERFLSEIGHNHLRDPRVALISYSSLDYVSDKEELRNIMATQLSRPVLWSDLIRMLCNNGHRLLIEIGPGEVISRTVRWIDRNMEIMNSGTNDCFLKTIDRCRMLEEHNGGQCGGKARGAGRTA